MAKVAAQLNPKIDVPGWPGFLLWARKERPAQYAALVTQVPMVAEFESQLKGRNLGDLSDFFSSIGSGLASAGSSIMDVFTSIAPAALSFGTTLVAAKSAQNLTNTQLQLAAAQRAPAQTATIQTANGPQTVPVTMNAAGQYVPATVNAAGQYVMASPTGGGFMASLSSIPVTTWLIGAGALAGILMLVTRRN